ncbi:tetratricopeptide repeat protein 28-like [Porites lutea]
MQFNSHLIIALNSLVIGGSITEILRNLYESIQKCEEMHDFLRLKDQFKISFFDEHVSPYLILCRLLIAAGSHYEALYVAELGRSRALTDVLSDKYSVDKGVSVKPQLSRIGIENIMNKNTLSSCLYVSCFGDDMFFWILKPNKMIVFRQTRLKESADKVFGNQTFGGSLDLRQDQCEDRSLFSCVSSPPSCKPSQGDSFESLRLIEEEEDENHDSKPLTLADGYNMIVAPVADLLQESEIIIVPDNLLYPIPFAALMDDNGKYLSDTFRIRIVPSLATLKLIQLSPTDYHSATGALIVGEPEVGDVYYQGKLLQLNSLPWARKEAEMIGRLLGVQPLLGRNANKQAVLDSMHSVSLIHFAAHGYAERGEIALSPVSSCGTPHEEDYLLTMAEISQVRLTAKLVVLSCCHSARGQVRAEGIVGIARAFLASGARAVLAALWAVEDEATMWFMNHFYEHLVRGESASESLHQAMKSMRETRFSDVMQWAPFMLIGDDVTFKGAFDKSSLKDGEGATETKNL